MTTAPDSSAKRPGVADRGVVPRGLIVLLGTSAAVITCAGIHVMAWLVGPVFLALTIVISVSPLQSWLLRKGLPRWLTTIALLLAVYAVLVTLFLVLIVSLARLATLLPEYADRAGALFDRVGDLLARFGVGTDEVATIGHSVDLNRLVALVGSILAGVGGLTSNIVFLLSLLLFFAVEAGTAGIRIASIGVDRPWVAGALADFASGTRRYMVVTTMFGALVAVLDWVALLVLDIPLPVMWALLAFITNYIPNVGFIIGVVPPALLALLQDDWRLMLIVIVVYSVINFLCQSVIQTRVVGTAVGLSTTVAFIALLFWAWLIGPLGAVLAIPLTLLAKALLIDVDPKARWAGALIGVPKRAGSEDGTRRKEDHGA